MVKTNGGSKGSYPNQPGVGQILQRYREQAHLNLAKLADETHIKLEYLEALEANRFEDLPAAVFVKGYIKTYGQRFDFDPVPVIALLRRDYKESARGQLVAREFVRPLAGARWRLTPRLMAVSSALVIVLAGLLYSGWRYLEWRQPPPITLTQPTANQLVAATVAVEGQTKPDVILSINDQPVSLRPDGHFQTEVTFVTEGLGLIKVEAIDRRGKINQLSRTVYVKF